MLLLETTKINSSLSIFVQLLSVLNVYLNALILVNEINGVVDPEQAELFNGNTTNTGIFAIWYSTVRNALSLSYPIVFDVLPTP